MRSLSGWIRAGAGGLAIALLAAGAGTAVAAPAPEANNAQVWEAVTFGQSTDLNFATNVLPEKIGTNYAEPEHPGHVDVVACDRRMGERRDLGQPRRVHPRPAGHRILPPC